MKRNKITYPIIKTFKPILWKECRFCHKEFRKEVGYEIEELPTIQFARNCNNNIFSYCCNECINSIDILKEKVIAERNWRPSDK